MGSTTNGGANRIISCVSGKFNGFSSGSGGVCGGSPG